MKNKLPHLTSIAIIVAAVAVIASHGRSGAADAPSAATATAATTVAPSVAPAVPSPYEVPKPKKPSVGDALLAHVTSRLERRSSVSARLALGGTGFYGTGSYWQQGSGDELRVRLELQLASQDAKLLQISDSRFLWVDRKLPTGRLVTRVDLRQLRADPTLSPANLDGPEPGSANWSPTGAGLLAHSGGLPSLFASLVENFEFLTPQAMRRAADANTPNAASFPVYAVVGHWRADKLEALLSKPGEATIEEEQSEAKAVKTVPARMPEEVLILVGQADLFPYRIEFRKLETPRPGADGPPIPFELSTSPMAALEFTAVVFDQPIATGQFDYAPGDAEWTDQTAVVLQRLRQQRDQVAGRSTPAPK